MQRLIHYLGELPPVALMLLLLAGSVVAIALGSLIIRAITRVLTHLHQSNPPATPQIEVQDDHYGVHRQLIRECRAMTLYALSIGRRVPGPMLQALEPDTNVAYVQNVSTPKNEKSEEPATVAPDTETTTVPPGGINIQLLASLHGQLCDIIAPAKPRTILLLEEEKRKGGRFQFLGSVGLVRRMMVVALICMVLFVCFAVSPYVEYKYMYKTFLEQDGVELFTILMFLLSVSGLGASFNALFTANRYIQEGTFDPVFEASYWTRFVLGLMAGLILSQLIPVNPAMHDAASAVANTPKVDINAALDATEKAKVALKPVLALLGGFSVSLVYRLLNHLLTSVETLVRGDGRELRQANEQLDKARASETESANRLQLLAKLSSLQQKLHTSKNTQEILMEFEKIQQQIAMHGPFESPSPEALAVVQQKAGAPTSVPNTGSDEAVVVSAITRG